MYFSMLIEDRSLCEIHVRDLALNGEHSDTAFIPNCGILFYPLRLHELNVFIFLDKLSKIG